MGGMFVGGPGGFRPWGGMLVVDIPFPFSTSASFRWISAIRLSFSAISISASVISVLDPRWTRTLDWGEDTFGLGAGGSPEGGGPVYS